MKRVSGGLNITGTIDGTTLITEVVVERKPLLQYFDRTTYRPDFAAIYAGAGGESLVPRIHVRAYDSATGADVTGTQSLTAYKYNGTSITFNPTTGVATAPAIVRDKLKLSTMTYSGQTIECILVIGNLAAQNNTDDDFISFDGTCVVGGSQVSFANARKEILIREIQSTTSGNDLILRVPENESSYIYRAASGSPVATRRIATVYKNGIPLESADLAGVTFEWADITYDDVIALTGSSTGVTLSQTLVSGDTIQLAEAAVDGLMQLRCIAKDSSGNTIAVGICGVPDLSDELQCGWRMANNTNGATPVELANLDTVQIRDGEAKVFTPYVRIGGEEASAYSNSNWTFGLDDNNGDAVQASSLLTASAVNNKRAIIAYGDVVKVVNGVKTKRPLMLSATLNLS